MGRAKGLPKTGGRKKGTPNKMTVEVKSCIKKMLESYTGGNKFMDDFNALSPKDRLFLAERLMNYVVPKMQSVSVEDVDKDKKSTIEMLIQLRDGNTDVIPNLTDSEDEDEDGKAIYLRFKSVFAVYLTSNKKTAKNG